MVQNHLGAGHQCHLIGSWRKMMTFKANTKTKAKARVRFSRLLVFVDWLRFLYLFMLMFV